jgi:hypothetical protein
MGLTLLAMTTFFLRTLTLFAAVVCSMPLSAAEPAETNWADVCAVARGRELILKTNNGETVYGYCSTISIDAIDVETKDRRIVKIARNALSRIQVRREKGRQLRSLGRGMRTGLRYGSNQLLSPAAPVGLVVLPATLAWGAVSAPFCVLGDLRYRLAGQKEIKLK